MAKIFHKLEDPDDVGITEVTDESPMPFGEHEKKKMKDVPASYLIWMHDNLAEREAGGQKLRDDETAVLNYTSANLDALELHSAAGRMLGRMRNQPCPCGSGVKLKKCCGNGAGRFALENNNER